MDIVLENLVYLSLASTLAGLYYGLDMMHLFDANCYHFDILSQRTTTQSSCKHIRMNKRIMVIMLFTLGFVVPRYISNSSDYSDSLKSFASLTLLALTMGMFGGFMGKMIFEKISYEADMRSLRKSQEQMEYSSSCPTNSPTEAFNETWM